MSKGLYLRNLLLLAAIVLSVCGCRRGEFELDFQLPADLSATYTAVYHDSRDAATVETVANIAAGHGKLKCRAGSPTLLTLNAGGVIPLTIYAEPGQTISVKGDSRNAATWLIEGNKLNEELTLWRNAHSETLSSGTQLEVNEAIADFALENPGNPAAPVLLLTGFSRRLQPDLFRRLWNGLLPEAQKAEWADLIGAADVMDGLAKTPGRFISIAMRSLANGTDTLRTASVPATLLFFWTNNTDGRRELIDSLKILSSEYPDSAKRIIADICLEADSLNWRSNLRTDSLEGVARLWAPAGLADVRVMELGVPRTPFFIVAQPDGHQAYRGQDSGKALGKFRSLMPDSLRSKGEKESAHTGKKH